MQGHNTLYTLAITLSIKQVAHQQTKSFLAPSITPKQCFQFYLNFYLLVTQIKENEFYYKGFSMTKYDITSKSCSKWIYIFLHMKNTVIFNCLLNAF